MLRKILVPGHGLKIAKKSNLDPNCKISSLSNKPVPKLLMVHKGFDNLEEIKLDNYKKEWNERHGCWSDKPVHNFASDGADVFRYLAQKKLASC